MAYKSKFTGAEIDSLLDKVKNGNNINIDNTLSESSENPVQNKVVTSAINDLKGSLQTLSDSVSSLNEKVNSHNEDIAKAVSMSTNAINAVNKMTEHINELTEEVGALSDKVDNIENNEITWTDVQ